MPWRWLISFNSDPAADDERGWKHDVSLHIYETSGTELLLNPGGVPYVATAPCHPQRGQRRANPIRRHGVKTHHQMATWSQCCRDTGQRSLSRRARQEGRRQPYQGVGRRFVKLRHVLRANLDASGMRAGGDISAGQRQGWLPDIYADHPHRRTSFCCLEGHGANTRPDIEKAAGERGRQPWAVSGESDNTADVVAGALALGLQYGRIPKNPAGSAVNIVEQVRRVLDLQRHIR